MFILIFEQLLKMFFIMVLAFVCYKIRLVDQNGNKTVSNLLLLIVNPILRDTGGEHRVFNIQKENPPRLQRIPNSAIYTLSRSST